jgi:diacylglycerol kinase family enzyme
MRITLMHNPKAGHGKHTKKELMDALAMAGHQATYQSTQKKDYKKALKKPTDLVIAAGGDGTVGKVALRLVDSGIPLSVIPLGTANNLARSLGFVRSPQDIIARIENGRKRAFDVGIARGPWGKRFLFEGAGGGLLADYLRAANETASNGKKLSKKLEMRRHVSSLRQTLQNYPARKWKIDVDGKQVSGRYILWEALNIHSVGPALYLAGQASTKDGHFDLVCVSEGDRSVLSKYLDARLTEKKTKFPLPNRRFRELNIIYKKATIHLDDDFWPRKRQLTKRPVKINITVEPSALVILQIPRHKKRREKDPAAL